MKYRELGRTGLMVSEIGLGGEWLERHNAEEVSEIIKFCESAGINILDCWMSEPNVRTNIGNAIKGSREKWIIEGHFGSTWQDGQYVRTRELDKVQEAFTDLLTRLQTDYIDLGMIHFIDEAGEFERVMNDEFYEYVKSMKDKGVIRHIGMSTHNPAIAKLGALSGKLDLMLFSINPAFDMFHPTEVLDDFFADVYDEKLGGISPERAEAYSLCEEKGVGLTVMKCYAGGRLFSAEASPFGAALTPVQCLHYALTRPAVASVMVGVDTVEHVKSALAYETATSDEKDYASVLAKAPHHAYSNQCTYCGHCSPCPKEIDIAMVNKLFDLAKMQGEVPPTVRAHYNALTKNASDCIGCRACESRCPFGVGIADKMSECKKLFEA